ncbi:MAG: MASE3 domain-containing protein [Alkalispirochaetaceae bacterium]
MAEPESGDATVGSRERMAVALSGAVLLAILIATSSFNFLLFHSLAEMASIVIACALFFVAFHTRRYTQSDEFAVVGVAYLLVAVIDTLHTLAYEGMGVFPGHGSNLPTQLWVAARTFEAISLLGLPLLFQRRVRLGLFVSGYILLGTAVLVAIFSGLFPVAYEEGVGLTPFKKTAEFVIIGILLGALYGLRRRRKEMSRTLFVLLSLSVAVTIVSEIAFVLYVDVYGLSNIVGHYLKVVSFYLIYAAIVRTSLISPFDLLFRNLRESEESLRKALKEQEVMAHEVNHRVKNNLALVSSLVRLQSSSCEECGGLDNLRSRIDAIQLVHEELARSGDVMELDLAAYMRRLLRMVFDSLSESPVSVSVDAVGKGDERFKMSSKSAVSLGLVLNELATNALKHSFAGEAEEWFAVTLQEEGGEQYLRLTIEHSGPPLPQEFTFSDSDTLGAELITEIVTEQLGGSFETYSSEHPTFEIRLPADALR